MNLTKYLIPSRAIYYPTIEIRDINLIKRNLLYFDSIKRIVPSEVRYIIENEKEDSQEIDLLASQGFLENINPEIYKEDAERKFLDKFLPILEQPTELAMQFIGNDRGFDIHVEKMTHGLRDKLLDLNLVDQSDGWINASNNIGQLYMICLAAVMGRRMNSPLISENESQHNLGEYASFGDSKSLVEKEQESEFSNVLGQLKIPFPSCEAIRSVESSRIIDFSQRYREERWRFRATLEEIADFLKHQRFDDPNLLQDYLSDQRRDIEAAMNDYYRTFQELLPDQGIGSLVQAFVLETPLSGLASAVTFGTTLLNPAAGLATGAILGLVISLREWYASHELNKRAAVSDTPEEYLPWHYLVHVNQEFPEPASNLNQF